jgi:hypothetical protein
LMAVATIIAACGAPVALRTAPAAVDACDEALLAGELVASSQSGLAVRTADQVTEVLWPFGYSASRETGGLVLRDETGTVIAHEGHRVEMTGGLGGQGAWKACAGTIREVSNGGG